MAAVMGSLALARVLALISGTWPHSGWRGFNDGMFWFLVYKQLLPQETQGLMILQVPVCSMGQSVPLWQFIPNVLRSSQGSLKHKCFPEDAERG